ncbi:MAG TPA: sialate O-acetylesterase [Candidatus Pullilachnospira intestinigallinarum]|nr:sialate O-acetylesterase [Candidatus Pullilachnospira intestinigallinarum]
MNQEKRRKRVAALLLVAIVLVFWNLIQMLSPSREQIRVACVGDSITYGTGVENREENCYPVKLQEALGTEQWRVGNFGVDGATVQEAPKASYREQDRYRQSLDYEAKVVVLMLGTNDAKTGNWKDRETFLKDYGTLVESYRSLDASPEVILVTPPCVFAAETGEASFGVEADAVSQIALAVKAYGAEEGLTVIDLYALTENHPEWFREDGIHPNAEGAARIAGAVYDAVKATDTADEE